VLAGLWIESAAQPGDDDRGLAAHARDELAIVHAHGLGTDHLVVREVVHQADVEGNVVAGNVLEQREHVFARGGGQEVIGVLDALRDAFKAFQVPERVVLQEAACIGFGDRGEYGNVRTP
jgi:hypothetical protein